MLRTTPDRAGSHRWLNRLHFLVWSLLACLPILAVVACSPPEPIRIGFLGGLSGRVADLGIGGRNGALLAVEMRNRQGGINGRPIELIAADDQQDEESARQAVARLLTRKVEVIIGPMTSAMALAVLPQMNAAGVPLLSPTVTTNALTALDDQFLRVVAPTAAHAPKSAEYYFAHGARQLALAYDARNQAYSESWSNDFQQAFKARGGTIVAAIRFAENTSWSDLATRLLALQTRRSRHRRQLGGYGPADPTAAHASPARSHRHFGMGCHRTSGGTRRQGG